MNSIEVESMNQIKLRGSSESLSSQVVVGMGENKGSVLDVRDQMTGLIKQDKIRLDCSALVVPAKTRQMAATCHPRQSGGSSNHCAKPLEGTKRRHCPWPANFSGSFVPSSFNTNELTVRRNSSSRTPTTGRILVLLRTYSAAIQSRGDIEQEPHGIMNPSSSFVHDFLPRLQKSNLLPLFSNGHQNALRFNRHDHIILSTSTPHAFQMGTGTSIFTQTLIPAITSAKSELIFVTCFWAPSKSLSALHDALAKLAAHRRGNPGLAPLRVRICLSSRSLLQKLLHPQSDRGYVYPPSSWQKDLGLPSPELLKAGNIELQVKSLFFLPFSVMHPKFVIIDRQRAFVTSCNVSWEAWLEGCVEVTGGAVQDLLSFYSQTWDRDLDTRKPLDLRDTDSGGLHLGETGLTLITSSAHLDATIPPETDGVPTLVLPSQFHRNPRFRPFPWQRTTRAPATPLNTTLLELFGGARHSIYVQTPNLTCGEVITALLDAVERGVDVTIVTSRNMMLLEQLVTAGTTTAWCIRSLLRRYRKLVERFSRDAADTEVARPRIGRLRVSYFRPRRVARAAGHEGESLLASGKNEEEPVHSHVKLTIVDGEYTVLGSGNMDRASWYTSQELGILFHDANFATAVKTTAEKVLETRLDLVFDSAEH